MDRPAFDRRDEGTYLPTDTITTTTTTTTVLKPFVPDYLGEPVTEA